jgi:hypothetical protein
MLFRFGTLAAGTCALMLAFVPSAHAATGMEVAVQDDPTLLQGLYSDPQIGLALADKLHASRVRVNVVWSYVVGRDAKKKTAPKNIRYNWTGYDGLISNASARGMKLQFVLTGTAPAWATGNHRIGPVNPKASAFKAFAKAAAEHFRGRVDRYSIWNEPNHRAWISPVKSAPRVYRRLYTAGYSAIKQADPSAMVLLGETSPFDLRHGRNATAPLKFLRAVTCANKRYKRARSCATLKTDGYAHHPYDFDHKPTYKYPGKDNVTIGVLGRLTGALSKLRKAKLLTTPTGGVPFLYLTEYGYFSSGKRSVSPSKHGKYLVQAFTIAQRNRRVKEMLHYLLVQPSSKYRFFDTSIANRSGKPTTPFKKLEVWAKKAAAAGRIAVATPPTTTETGSTDTPPQDSGSGSPPADSGGGSPTPSCSPLPVCP